MDPHYPDYLRTVRRLELDAILASLNQERLRGRTLEIGIGEGYVSSFLYGKCEFLLSTDIAEQLYDRSLRTVLRLLLCDTTSLPFHEKKFDSIFALNVLEHINTPALALLEMRRVLKPFGILVIALPNVTWKILQLFSYYPYVLLRIYRIALNWIVDFKGGEDSVKEVLGRHGISRLLFPPVHGVYNGHLQELIGLRAKAWEKLFVSCGFLIAKRIKLPCYSPYPFWLSQLRILEKLKISSSYCYILKRC